MIRGARARKGATNHTPRACAFLVALWQLRHRSVHAPNNCRGTDKSRHSQTLLAGLTDPVASGDWRWHRLYPQAEQSIAKLLEETISDSLFQTSFAMASKGLTVDGITFPDAIVPPASSKSLTLIGNGVTDMTIETILVKFSAIAVYVESDIAKYMQAWKGKPTSELVAEDSAYFEDFVNAPVQKLVKVGIIKGIRGSAYAGGLESSIRDRLAYDDKYEEEEEATLEELVKYLSTHNLPVGSSIFFHWPTPSVVQVTVSPDCSVPKQVGNTAENQNVAKFLLQWFIGENSVSESTALSTAGGVAAL